MGFRLIIGLTRVGLDTYGGGREVLRDESGGERKKGGSFKLSHLSSPPEFCAKSIVIHIWAYVYKLEMRITNPTGKINKFPIGD